MTKRPRTVMACIVIGSLIYIFILQLSLLVRGLPTEPPKPEFRKICSTSYARNNQYGAKTMTCNEPNCQEVLWTEDPHPLCLLHRRCITIPSLQLLRMSCRFCLEIIEAGQAKQDVGDFISSVILAWRQQNGEKSKDVLTPGISLEGKTLKDRLVPSFPNIQEPFDESIPVIYIVTPTYQRPERIAELTRLGQTLLLVPHVHWIIADDSNLCVNGIHQLLKNLGLPFTHLVSPMPDIYRKLTNGPRGVSNRRAALQWVKEHGTDNAVLYFLDDDNAIDVRLFEEMRDTQKVSMFPVGLIGKYAVSAPVINKDGFVTGFYDAWPAGRKFQVDMAGFAVNVGFLKKQKKVSMPYSPGHEEDGFLKSLEIDLKDIEVKANLCTEILVWHTRTVKNKVQNILFFDTLSQNIKKLLNRMRSFGLVNLVKKKTAN